MRNWLQVHPFVVLLLPLIAGILLCEYTGFPFDMPYAKHANFPDSIGVYAAVIEDYPVEKSKTFRYTASTNYGKIYLYLRKDSTKQFPSIGDGIQFRGTITKPDSIGSFDYGKYLRRQGIVGQSFVRSKDWQITGHTSGGIGIFARRLQYRLIERYRELGISGNELGTLSALTLGYREDLDPDIKRSFQRSGASHILAVSGLHTGIIYTVVWALLTCFGLLKPLYEDKIRRRINGVIIISFMFFYAFLTGLSPSVCRSVIMLAIIQTAYMCYRRPNGINGLAAAAFIILILRPNDLFSVSFQLSFAAVLSIILLEPLFSHLIPQKIFSSALKNSEPWYIDTFSNKDFFENIIFPISNTAANFLDKLFRYIGGIITASIAVQIGTLPITLYYFHQTCNYFILTNIVVIPLAFCITLLAFATLTIGWIPFFGEWLAYPLNWFTWALNHYTAFIESLPGAYSVLPF